MSSYPFITAAVADQRRRDLIAQADAYRLARAARQGSGGRPFRSRTALTMRRLVIAAAAGCAALTVFTLSPAGAAHPSAMPMHFHRYAPAAASLSHR
jgi:hypothetical protein